MSFLKKIDTMHSTFKDSYAVNELDDDFSSFINVEPIGVTLTKKFEIKKQEKAKLLIVSEKQRVYLSDYQILTSILKMGKEYIDWFLTAFIGLYNGKFKKFSFKIDDETFDERGIPYYPESKEMVLFSDTKVDINDFIFVVNFVFAKDYRWEQDNNQTDFSKRTIVKYITLLDYYFYKRERSKRFLEKIGYPINNEEFFDEPKSKKMFAKTNLFDISEFL